MDRWDGGSDYDAFMGRWSVLVAERFLADLDLQPGLRWLDVGCGTGALSNAIAGQAAPSRLVGVDPSPEFLEVAASRIDGVAELRVGDGENLAFDESSFDVVVSGLALNFMPNPEDAIREWWRVTGPGGVVGAYVWDYAEGMEFLRRFWDAAVSANPEAASLDEAKRFPICRPDELQQLFTRIGLTDVLVGSVEVPTVFADFDDYWAPFLSGQGPAPSYVASLTDQDKNALERRLRDMLGSQHAIALDARAWTIIGRTPPRT